MRKDMRAHACTDVCMPEYKSAPIVRTHACEHSTAGKRTHTCTLERVVNHELGARMRTCVRLALRIL